MADDPRRVRHSPPSGVVNVGCVAATPAGRLGRRVASLPPALRATAAAAAQRLGPPLPGGPVYTDDRAPVEWLIDRSILGYASDPD